VRRLDVGDPVADGFVDGVLECTAAGLDGDYLGSEQVHAQDVHVLAFDVLAAHVHVAFEAEQGGGGGGGDAVLAGPGLGDNPRLAHALGEQDLANRVVDFVGAGMGQVLAL
jgi:hypothetical protein